MEINSKTTGGFCFGQLCSWGGGGGGELFHGKWALDDKILTAGFKEWQNSMISLKSLLNLFPRLDTGELSEKFKFSVYKFSI